MPKPFELLSCATAVACLGCPPAVQAQTPGAAPQATGETILKVGYKITPEAAARPAPIGPHNVAAAAAKPVLPPDAAPAAARKFEPQWVHEIGARGPSVELAALGAGRPDTPSLVHFAFSWNF